MSIFIFFVILYSSLILHSGFDIRYLMFNVQCSIFNLHVPPPLAKTCVFLLFLSKKNSKNRRKPLSIKGTIFFIFSKHAGFYLRVLRYMEKKSLMTYKAIIGHELTRINMDFLDSVIPFSPASNDKSGRESCCLVFNEGLSTIQLVKEFF